MIKIFHCADIHYCEKYLDEVDKCLRAAWATATSNHEIDAVVIAGDLFDRKVDLHSPATDAAMSILQEMATEAPVLILQGTRSHDIPGSLRALRFTGAAHGVVIAESPGHWGLNNGKWIENVDFPEFKPGAIFSTLPPMHKGELMAAAGDSSENPVQSILAKWKHIHHAATNLGIPTILVSHGTVDGCLTEHGVPMSGQDHEFTAGTLLNCGASAVMLGHIHKHQHWNGADGKCVAYPGSIGRLHFGERDPKGALVWTVEPGYASFEFIETPARRLIEVDFEGLPNDADLAKIAKDCRDAHVRVRYTVDEDSRHRVSRDDMESLLSAAGAALVKIEGRVEPIVRTRAQGIGEATDIAEMLSAWNDATDQVPIGPLLDRLRMLEEDASTDEIADRTSRARA